VLSLDSSIVKLLRCPRDLGPLEDCGDRLRCGQGHDFPIVNGIPVLMFDDGSPTIGLTRKSLECAWKPSNEDPYFIDTLGISDDEKRGVASQLNAEATVDPVVSYLVGATNGILYKHLIGELKRYPIPEIELEEGARKTLLDIGCSWGRWSIAASMKGYTVIGIDPSLGAVMAAQRTARFLGVSASFLVADARYLPFESDALDTVFSYSVLQHFSEPDLEKAVKEVGRILRDGGSSRIQMANRMGLRSIWHQARRGYKQPEDFDVRYWSVSSMKCLFQRLIGPTGIEADCFFGLGLQATDRNMMTVVKKIILDFSELLKKFAKRIRFMVRFADSVWILSSKRTD